MVRDKRKSADYYNSYIDYQGERIRKKSAKLLDSGSDSAKAERINQSLLKFKADMVYAQFSVGAVKNKLTYYLVDALRTASQVIHIDYEILLNLLSLSVMMEIRSDSSAFIAKHRDVIQNDKILNCLAEYLQSGKVVWEGSFTIRELYDRLDNLANAADKESIMAAYLSDWYHAHKDFAWYGSHENDKDTYVGYWSFESAALAKVMGVDESKLRGKEYYPLL